MVLGQVSPSTSVSCANSQFTDCSTLIINIRVGTIGQIVADVPSGLSLTLPQEKEGKVENIVP
jgi:hypothetical protein